MNKILKNTILGTSVTAALFFTGCGSDSKKVSITDQYQFKGALNTDFANTGYAVHDGGNDDEGRDAVVDKDGNIYVTGYINNGTNKDMAIWKYKNDGTLDTSFDSDGIVTHGEAAGGSSSAGTSADEGRGIALDKSGNIYVSGYSHNGTNDDMAIWRYKSDGTLDTSFNSTGYVTHGEAAGGSGASGKDNGLDIALDESGNIYVAGTSRNSTDNDMIIWKYKSDGSLDTSFDSDGFVIYDGSIEEYAESIVLDSSNNIYITGKDNNGSKFKILTLKYKSDGSPDTSFNSTGIATYESNTATSSVADYGNGIALDSKNNVYVTGQVNPTNSDRDMVILKYTSSGTLDSSFGSNGVVTHDGAAGGSGKDDAGYAIEIDFVDDIYVAGYSSNGTDLDMAIWKYKGEDGTLDTSFNSVGYATHAAAAGGTSKTEVAYSIAFNSSKNNIYTVGYAQNNTPDNDMTIWNYQ